MDGRDNYLEGCITHMDVLRLKIKCEVCQDMSGVRGCRARSGSEWE